MTHQPEKSPGAGQEDRGEEVIGQVPVVAELALGIEKLTIVVTTRRLIMAHVSKKGVGALASVPFLGKFALDKLEKEKAGSKGPQKDKPPSVAEVLGAHKDNFQIEYKDVAMAEVRRSPSGLRILILTGDDKFQFITGEDFRQVEKLLRGVLGTKLSVSASL